MSSLLDLQNVAGASQLRDGLSPVKVFHVQIVFAAKGTLGVSKFVNFVNQYSLYFKQGGAW